MDSIDQILSKNDHHLNLVCDTQSKPSVFEKLNISTVFGSIVLFEILVCILGAHFYISIGYEVYSAIILAVTVEAFYMYFSSKSGLKSSIIKVVLLLISVTALSYSAYKKDVNVINSIKLINSNISDANGRLEEVNVELASLKGEKQQIDKDMELFREYKKATIGNQILAPRRTELEKRRSNLIAERAVLKDEISKEGSKLVNQSIFANIWILTIQTIISILAFTTIQIAICVALPDILTQLKTQINQED